MRRLTLSDRMRLVGRVAEVFVFFGLILFAVVLGVSIFFGSTGWSTTEKLLLLIATVLVLILRETRLLYRRAEVACKTRDTDFPVFSRAELMSAQEAHECWARLVERDRHSLFSGLSDEGRRILAGETLNDEVLKNLELEYGDYQLKELKLPRSARRLLMEFQAEYWEEVTRRRLIRMVEANIAVSNGSRSAELREDPLHDLCREVPNVAERLREWKKGVV